MGNYFIWSCGLWLKITDKLVENIRQMTANARRPLRYIFVEWFFHTHMLLGGFWWPNINDWYFMSTENKAMGFLCGKGESKILLRHPYGLVKMARDSNYVLYMSGTLQYHLYLVIACPPAIAWHQWNILLGRNCPVLKNNRICIHIFPLSGRRSQISNRDLKIILN